MRFWTLLVAALVMAPSIALAGEHAEAPAETPAKAPVSETFRPTAGDAPREHGAPFNPAQYFHLWGSPGAHYGKDATGGPLGDGVMTDPHTGEVILDHHGRPFEEPMSPAFIFLVLNFALFLWILARFGGPAFRKLAADRHDQIKTALDEAAKLREAAAAKLGEYESKLKRADDEITKLVAGMRADAEADQKRILDNAERQAAQMKRDAESRIAAEIEAARAALTREVTAAAAAAAEQLLREKITPADQGRIVASFIADVQGATRTEAR
jgi:F-type H+-transporting ATPase subunit b